MIYEVSIAEKSYRVELFRADEGQTKWTCKLNGREFPIDAALIQEGVLSILLNGKSYEVKQELVGAETNIVIGHERFNASVRDPRSFRSRQRAGASEQGVKKITAPMPGKVVRILAAVGDQVEAGQSVIVIEAMKMQNELCAKSDAIVRAVHVEVGQTVERGALLIEFE